MKIIIPLPLMTLNQYTNANRANRFGGASSKKKATNICKFWALDVIEKGLKLDQLPVDFIFDWYAKDMRTDKDNIAFQRKFIFDGFIAAGLLQNDGWKEIGNWVDNFHIDKEEPRVEITIQTKGDK